MTSVMCIMMGAMGAGQATLTLGDIGKAKLAAYRLFKVIDRKSLIDPEQPGAVALNVKEISFERVSFAYPARPDAQVTKELSFVARQGIPVDLALSVCLANLRLTMSTALCIGASVRIGQQLVCPLQASRSGSWDPVEAASQR